MWSLSARFHGSASLSYVLQILLCVTEGDCVEQKSFKQSASASRSPDVRCGVLRAPGSQAVLMQPILER